MTGVQTCAFRSGFVGRTVQTSDLEIIEVKFQETDGAEKVLLVERVAEAQ